MDSEHRLALPKGTVINQYRVDSLLGYGGFGIVYKAQHERLGTWVAIKEYLPNELATREGGTVHPLGTREHVDFQTGLDRFLVEAKQLVQFENHPNVVSCRDFIETNGTAYLVMDFEDGLPLSDLIRQREKNNQPFNEGELLRIMLPLLDGLAVVHKQNVLHRDIKPGNIFIRRATEKPVLIDFGAAKQNFSEHSKSMAPYSPGYAAIEQIESEGNLGPWTDIYAIGAVMWRIVAQKNPPQVENRMSAASRHRPDPMTLAVEIGKGRYSVQTLEAIDKCLRFNEDERFQSVEELVRSLKGEGVSSAAAKPTSESKPAQKPEPSSASRPEKPSNSKTIIFALIVIVLMIGAGYGFVQYQAAEDASLAQVEADKLAQIETDKLAQIETDRLAQAETDRLAQAETDRLAQVESDRLSQVERDRLARIETDRLAQIEADRLSQIEADRLAQIEADRLAQIEADRLAQTEFERQRTGETLRGVNLGDDSGDWSNDGECDDPRFSGGGMASTVVEADARHDATDCRALLLAGEIVFNGDINYGNNSSDWADDGECDDPRFGGGGMASTLVDADARHDATDCRALLIAGDIVFIGGVDFGDDSSSWSDDGECDDPRFSGGGMASTLLDEDERHDATDCRTLYLSGEISFEG